MPRAFLVWIQWTLALCGLALALQAQDGPTPRALGVVKVAQVVGDVFVTEGTTPPIRLGPNSLVTAGQVIETRANSSVILVFSNGALVNVRANAQLEVNQFLQDPYASALTISGAAAEPSTSVTRLNLRKGEIISQVKKLNREAGSSFTVDTPVGAAGIRGTAFRLRFVPSGSAARFGLSMAEGVIQFLQNQGRAVEVAGGKELSFDVQIDPSTGRVISMPELPALTDVSSTDMAELQAVLIETIAVSSSIEFTPNPAAGAPAAGAAASTETAPIGMASPAPVAEASSTTPVAPSPGPIADAPRTSPGSGE